MSLTAILLAISLALGLAVVGLVGAVLALVEARAADDETRIDRSKGA